MCDEGQVREPGPRSIFQSIKKSKAKAKEHKASIAERQRAEANSTPYKHVVRHAKSDAMSAAPPNSNNEEMKSKLVAAWEKKRELQAEEGNPDGLPNMGRRPSSVRSAPASFARLYSRSNAPFYWKDGKTPRGFDPAYHLVGLEAAEKAARPFATNNAPIVWKEGRAPEGYDQFNNPIEGKGDGKGKGKGKAIELRPYIPDPEDVERMKRALEKLDQGAAMIEVPRARRQSFHGHSHYVDQSSQPAPASGRRRSKVRDPTIPPVPPVPEKWKAVQQQQTADPQQQLQDTDEVSQRTSITSVGSTAELPTTTPNTTVSTTPDDASFEEKDSGEPHKQGQPAASTSTTAAEPLLNLARANSHRTRHQVRTVKENSSDKPVGLENSEADGVTVCDFAATAKATTVGFQAETSDELAPTGTPPAQPSPTLQSRESSQSRTCFHQFGLPLAPNSASLPPSLSSSPATTPVPARTPRKLQRKSVMREHLAQATAFAPPPAPEASRKKSSKAFFSFWKKTSTMENSAA
ncbi:hypothetical protein F4780DRAFT_310570 [Xylariomycetidae sp. FL0641]|nr:hypothetical protein F4780DRAFT_310570 [Xylariomycetidae sp. FL0641]